MQMRFRNANTTSLNNSVGLLRKITEFSPKFFKKFKLKKKQVSEEQSLEAVVDGTLFGVVDLDIISTPDHWPEGSDYISEPHEYFKIMVPIFCTTDIPF